MEGGTSLSNIIVKGTHLRTIPARFGLIWFRGFRGEDLNVIVYDVRRMPSDGKSSHGLWPGELKTQNICYRVSTVKFSGVFGSNWSSGFLKA